METPALYATRFFVKVRSAFVSFATYVKSHSANETVLGY